MMYNQESNEHPLYSQETNDTQDDNEEDYHSFDCTCENCLQNHPERDILYGDGDYFNYPNPETCPHCGKELEDFSDLGCEYCDTRVFDQPENDCS